MELVCKRFPHILEMVSNNLDDQSLIALKESSKEVSKSMDKERFFWIRIRIIRRYNGNFKKFKESWMEVLQKTPMDKVRQIANVVQKFFDSYPYYIVSKRQLAPLHVAAVQGDLQLCEHIITKTSEKNPQGEFCICTKEFFTTRGVLFDISNANEFYRKEFGMTTPLHIAAVKGNLELCKLILAHVVEKNPISTNGWTPLHMAVANGHIDVARTIVENLDDKNPIGSHGWIGPGSNVYVQHPVNKRWDSKAIIISRRSERTFLIEIEKDGRQFLRNRRFLRPCPTTEKTLGNMLLSLGC